MRTTLSLKIPKRSVTPLIAVLLLTGTVSLGTACDDDKDYSRREHIEWSNSPEFEEALTGTLHIPVRASKEQDATPFKRSIYIRSNVAYQVGFEGEKEESGELPAEEWLNVDEIKRGVRPGIDELVLLITPHTESYVERKGCISLHTDVEFLNEFIAVVQGFPKYTKDYEGNFDWLKYGSAEPLETRGETLIDSWTADQKKMGLESTPAQEGGTAYCYGKNGYVKLGDDAGHGANLLTPYDPGIRNDTAAMVRFNAIAYAAADGTKDNDELTVRITGGGQFADGTTEKTVRVGHLDPTAAELPTAMWKNSQQEFIIFSHPKNPFTSNTRMELMAGKYEMESGNTRIFIDNLYVLRLKWYDFEDLFGKLPWEQNAPRHYKPKLRHTMKKFYTNRYSMICAFAASALLLGGGCSEDETEPAIGSKGVSSEVFVSSDAGSRTIKVETSGPWQARLTPETRLWVSVDGADSGETGGSLNLNYRTNNSLPRKGTILVSSARQQVVDTIYLMQYGTTPLLEFKYIGKQYSSVSTIDSVTIDTNIPLSKKIYWTVVYDENSAAEPWADSVSYAQDFKYFRFRIADNKKFEPRAARFRLRFQDDWGEDHTTYFTAYQGIPGGTAETREMTFEELRGLIAEAEGEITLDQDIAVSGTVISDWASPNMAGSPMPKAAEKPDLGINDCTAYMQNADASLGLALVTTDAQQNNLQRYDKLKLWCKGLTLTKRSNPERYTLSGVTQDHIVTKEAGTAEELPAKRRFIDQLTDADIYTQVTLKRCQMAVRTGRFIPVHINYTNSFNNYYPAAVLDRHGDMIYLMTNHGCDWRFKEMPDGEGTITGIIVHEPYTFFERGGDIGRYQIRNVTREDIALDESADNVFSAVAVEWSPDGSKDPRAYAFPQYPHPATDSGQAHCVAATTGSGLSFMSTYAWLAVGSAYRAAENGLTINNASWGHKQLWDTAKNTGNSLIFEFSTQGVSSTQCSFVFTCRYHSAQGGLRYWTAEYSLDGDNWKKLTDFTVPDNGNWGNMQLEQLSGDKNVWMQVPTEILGQSVAWIRLRPVQNKIGTATTYDTATIASNGQVANVFTVSYAALRYNK